MATFSGLNAPAWHGSVVRWLPRASIAGFVGFLFAPGLLVGPSLDPAVFILAGDRIRSGGLPFKDVWDHKPPGAALLNALGDTVLPWLDPWLVSWLFTVVFTSLAILMVHEMLLRRVTALSAWFWSMVAVLGVASYPIALGGGYTESFALLPLVGALSLVDRSGPGVGARGCIAIGLLLSTCCLFSLQTLPAAVAIAVAAVWGMGRPAGAYPGADGRRAAGATAFRRVVALVGGGLLLPGIVLAWLAANGALADAVDQVVTYAAAYRLTGRDGLVNAVAGLLCIAGLLIPVAVASVRILRRPRRASRVEWLCLGWVIGSGLLVAYENRFYAHYLIPVVPALALLAAPSFGRLLSAARSPRPWARRLGFAAVVLTVGLLGTETLLLRDVSLRLNDGALTMQEYRSEIARWIESSTAPTDRVFIWGNNPEIHLATNRTPYGPYLYEFPLVTQGYWSPAKTQRLVSAWTADPPEIVVEGPSDVPMFEPASRSHDGRDYDTLDPLRGFVHQHYRLGVEVGVLHVYVLNERSPRVAHPLLGSDPRVSCTGVR
jgi:hypothetical protein